MSRKARHCVRLNYCGSALSHLPPFRSYPPSAAHHASLAEMHKPACSLARSHGGRRSARTTRLSRCGVGASGGAWCGAAAGLLHRDDRLGVADDLRARGVVSLLSLSVRGQETGRRERETHELLCDVDALADRRRALGVGGRVVQLGRDPPEGGARRRGEVVPQAEEVSEEERGEEAASRRWMVGGRGGAG